MNAAVPQSFQEALSPEQLEYMKREADTGWGTAGEVATNVALTAAPGGTVYKDLATRVGPHFLKRALAAAAPVGFVTEAALTPGDAGERGVAGLYGAAGGMAGETLGEVAGKVLKRTLARPIHPSASARELMRQDIQPTVGQGAENPIFRAVEDAVGNVPLVGTFVRKGQERAIGEFQQKLFAQALNKEALEQLPKLDPRMQVQWVQDVLGPQYDKLLGEMPIQQLSPQLRLVLRETGDRMPPSLRLEYEHILADQIGDRTEMTGDQLKKLLTELGELSGDLGNSASALERRAARQVGAARAKIKELMPPEMQQLDDLYTRFIRLKEASFRTLSPEEGITPRTYQQAVRSEGNAADFSKGNAPGQELSDPAQILRKSGTGLGPTAAGIGLGAAPFAFHGAAAVPIILGAAGTARPVAQFALGGYDWQRAMINALRRRPTYPPAALGIAAVEDD